MPLYLYGLARKEDKLAFACDDENSAVLRLINEISDAPSFIYVFSGADVSEDKAAELEALINERYPDTEVSFLLGGQPVYRYILSVEC